MKLIYHLNLHCTVQYIQCEQNTNITPPPKLRLSESYQKKKKKTNLLYISIKEPSFLKFCQDGQGGRRGIL